VLDIERTLGQGYSTPEEAIAPLRAAKPRLPWIIGYLGLPASAVTYRTGGGKGIVVLPIKVTVDGGAGSYSISVKITRIPPLLIITLALANSFLAFVSLGLLRQATFGPLLFLVACVLVFNGMFVAQYFFIARAAVKDFVGCYPKFEG
jgi:hypothetical protein